MTREKLECTARCPREIFYFFFWYWCRVESSASQGSSSMTCLPWEWVSLTAAGPEGCGKKWAWLWWVEFPGGQWGGLALSRLLLCPCEGVRVLKCYPGLPQATARCPWCIVSLARCEQLGAAPSSCDFSPHGVKTSLEEFKVRWENTFPQSLDTTRWEQLQVQLLPIAGLQENSGVLTCSSETLGLGMHIFQQLVPSELMESICGLIQPEQQQFVVATRDLAFSCLRSINSGFWEVLELPAAP